MPSPSSVASVAEDISSMRVHGAGRIARHAVRGLVVFEESYAGTADDFDGALEDAARILLATRPTAVSLANAIHFVLRRVREAPDGKARREALRRAAAEFETRSLAAVDAIGRTGATLLRDGGSYYTHCNSHASLSVFKAAKAQNLEVRVVADETRPWRQGFITARELHDAGLDTTFVVDAAAYSVLKQGIDAVFVGCDTIAANGDIVNKIGTSALALMCEDLAIPFYVCAETYKVRLDAARGEDVPIEERDEGEVAAAGELPEGVRVLNPVFDVTPAARVTGVVTELGVLKAGEVGGLARKSWA